MVFFSGFFSVRVSDPNYPDQLLFEYDIGVNCPNKFEVEFVVPTRGPDDYDRRLRVEIEDTYRTINLLVFRPAPNMTKETYGKSVTNIFMVGSLRIWFFKKIEFCRIWFMEMPFDLFSNKKQD